MAIWNNNTCNSHREFYKQYGTTPLNAQGAHNLSYFDQFILQNGATLANSLFQFIGQNVDFSGSSSSAASTGGAEVIQEHIDTILNKYSVSTIDDLEAKKEIQEAYDNAQKENETLKVTIANCDETITNCDKTIETNEYIISTNESKIQELEALNHYDRSNSVEIDILRRGIKAAEKAIDDAKQKKTAAEADRKIAQDKVDKNNGLENTNFELADLEKDIQDLKVYMKQLKKAEGRDAIEELVNEDTGNITDLINKYNRNPENGRVKRKLKEALEKYLSDDSIENKNQSIVNYAKFKAKDLGIDSALINQK